MATPFKRICRQAIRHASQYRSQCRCQQEVGGWVHGPQLRTSWSSLNQQRSYSQSRSLAAKRQQSSTDEDVALQIEEEDLIEELPSESDISSMGHAELDQHRELREMVRVAAWEMPLLSSLAKPFHPPNKQELPLRWRYTTYFGEPHPHSRKVVVCFNIKDLHELDSKQQDKLKKLCGARYNPEENSVRMSCESFETQAQNKRYLGDIVQKLIAEAKDPNADSFEDIPLDTRHHKFKKRLQFPEEWKMSPEKQQALEDKRRELLLEEGKRVEENTVVSGIAAVEAARQVNLQQVEEPVMAEARQPLPKGKMGRKEMGQTRRAQR